MLSELSDAFKVPETKEEAIDWVNNDPSSQTLIEEMAFRQVVVNILVAANIISEKDFNDSVAHFKKLFTDKFAEEMLSRISEFREKYDGADDESGDEWDDQLNDYKKTHQA